MKSLLSVLLLLLAYSLQAGVREDWLSVYKITQRHPVYVSGEPLQRPQGTFQLLMALHFIDASGKSKRDCVWYRLPSGESLGLLKIIRSETECRDWNGVAFWEISEVRSFSFKLQDHGLSFEFTNHEAQLKLEKFSFLNLPVPRTLDRFQSSPPVRQVRGVFFLSPHSQVVNVSLSHPALAAGVECSFSAGTCQRCAQGVVKVADLDRPHFKCGTDRCGEKNQLACRRGFEWKREREKPTCRLEPWHLYCQQGLRLECEGELGFCR